MGGDKAQEKNKGGEEKSVGASYTVKMTRGGRGVGVRGIEGTVYLSSRYFGNMHSEPHLRGNQPQPDPDLSTENPRDA